MKLKELLCSYNKLKKSVMPVDFQHGLFITTVCINDKEQEICAGLSEKNNYYLSISKFEQSGLFTRLFYKLLLKNYENEGWGIILNGMTPSEKQQKCFCRKIYNSDFLPVRRFSLDTKRYTSSLNVNSGYNISINHSAMDNKKKMVLKINENSYSFENDFAKKVLTTLENLEIKNVRNGIAAMEYGKRILAICK